MCEESIKAEAESPGRGQGWNPQADLLGLYASRLRKPHKRPALTSPAPQAGRGQPPRIA